MVQFTSFSRLNRRRPVLAWSCSCNAGGKELQPGESPMHSIVERARRSKAQQVFGAAMSCRSPTAAHRVRSEAHVPATSRVQHQQLTRCLIDVSAWPTGPGGVESGVRLRRDYLRRDYHLRRSTRRHDPCGRGLQRRRVGGRLHHNLNCLWRHGK